MKIRKTVYIFIFLFLCPSLLLSGCKKESNQLSAPKYATGDHYDALIDDSYVLMRMGNGQATYYRQFLNDGRLLELGKIDNFFLSTKGSVLLDKNLFFVASTQNSGTVKTSLYKIDLSNNTLSELTGDTLCSFDAYPFLYQNNIAIAKYYYEGDNIISCVDIYSLSDGTTNTILSKKINNKTLNGSIILRACGKDDEIAALTDLGQGENSHTTNINLFDNNAQLIDTISIENIKSYIMESRVYQMLIFDNYIYMSNYSNYSIWGAIEKNEITPLLQKRYLEYAGGTKNIILFIRGGNTVFIVDPKTQNIEEKQLDFDSGYVIRTVISNDEEILFFLKSEDNDEIVRYLTIDQLSSM